MNIIGFNFTKISIEKKSTDFSKIEVKSNIDILDIKEVKSELFKLSGSLIAVDFSYTIDYSPEIANLTFKGDILFSVDSKKAKEILKEWESKKIQEDFKSPLFNIILKKSNIKALSFEDEIGLPFHLPLPSFKKQD